MKVLIVVFFVFYYPIVGICHNEDGSLIDFDRTAILTVKTYSSSVITSFTAWCYVGQLPTAGRSDSLP